MSRVCPVGTGSTGWIRGCTYSVDQVAYSLPTRISRSGSLCPMVSGPTWKMPRRLVGNGYVVWWLSPAARLGIGIVSRRPVTASAAMIGGLRRLASLVTVMTPSADSPTATRCGRTSRSALTSGRASIHSAATISAARQANPSAASSG